MCVNVTYFTLTAGSGSLLETVFIPEEFFTSLVAGDHDGAGRGHLQQSRGQAGEESSGPVLRDKLTGDCCVTPRTAVLDSHYVLLPHLYLLEGLDDIEWEGDGAGHTAGNGPAEEGDEEVVIERCGVVSTGDVECEQVFRLFVQRPV